MFRNYTINTSKDPELTKLTFVYCDGRNFFWRCFFGWRETFLDNHNNNKCVFKLTKKQYANLLDIKEITF